MPDTIAPSTASGAQDTASNGAPTKLVLRECSYTTVWNLQGNPEDRAFRAWADTFIGVPLPVAANTSAVGELWSTLWLGPRSWLLLARTERTLEVFVAQRNAVNATGGALFDISASRVAFEISGPGTRQLLAAYCPLDLHPNAFVRGACAQSLLGHVNALYWVQAPEVFMVFVARSLARDTLQSLRATGARYGMASVPA